MAVSTLAMHPALTPSETMLYAESRGRLLPVGSFSFAPWSPEGTVGRLNGTGVEGPSFLTRYNECKADLLRGPDLAVFEQLGKFTHYGLPKMRDTIDPEHVLCAGHNGTLSPDRSVYDQLAEAGLDISGKRVALTTFEGVDYAPVIQNWAVWMARTGGLMRSVVVAQSAEECEALRGVVACWTHDWERWGATFEAGTDGGEK